MYNPFKKDISELEYEDLEKLIENEVSEEWSIEYKGSFPNNVKIAKSIASFANSKGVAILLVLKKRIMKVDLVKL